MSKVSFGTIPVSQAFLDLANRGTAKPAPKPDAVAKEAAPAPSPALRKRPKVKDATPV